MSFAKRFQDGAAAAKGLIDTYESAQRKRDIGQVMDAKPEDAYGFNQAEVGQVQAAVDSGQYDVGYDDVRKGYTVAAKSDPSQVGFVGQAPMTRFLGRDHQGALTPEQINAARYGALADIETKTDPVRGLQMRREITNQAREDKRFGDEQDDRGKKLKLETDRRSEYQVLSGLPPQELAERLGGAFSKDGSGVDAMLTFDREANKFMFASNVPGLPSRVLDRSELINYGMGIWEQGNGDFSRGMEQQLATLRELRKQQDATRGDAATLAKGDADRFDKGREHDLKVGELAIKRQDANTREQYYRQAGDAAGVRAAGGGSGRGGGNGVDAMWAKAEEIAAQGRFGGNPEKAYEVLKRGQARGGVQEDITKLEMKLREGGMPEEALQQQLGAFRMSRGLAPDSEVARLRAGTGADGKPLTAEDYASWDRRFPNMPVEDVLGESPAPSAAQLGLMRQDAAATGNPAPVFSWVGAGRTTSGALNNPGVAPAGNGTPSRMAPSKPPAPPNPVQAAYDAWQDTKQGWFAQETPTSRAREKEAEQRYLQLLRNQYSK